MAPNPPKAFVTIAEAYEFRDGRHYNVIGIVTDFLPPARSRGTDLTMKLYLWDVSCADLPTIPKDGMMFRFFYPTESRMPAIRNVGDLLILQHVKTLHQSGSTFGIGGSSSQWVVMPASSLIISNPTSLNDIDRRVSSGNRFDDLSAWTYAKKVSGFKDPSSFREPPRVTSLPAPGSLLRASSTPSKQKFRLISELEIANGSQQYMYADLLVELRKIWDSNNPIELKATDYTENELLYNYTTGEVLDGDDFEYISQSNNWTGPWGRRTMQISLWDENAVFIRDAERKGELKLGSYLQIQNVQIKMNKMNAVLEGHCRGSSFASHKRIVVLRPHEAETNSRLKGLLERKRNYERHAKEENLSFCSEPGKVNEKQQNMIENEPTMTTAALESEDPKHKRNRKNKGKIKSKQNPKGSVNQAQGESAAAETVTTIVQSNTNVRCEAINIPLTSISAILNAECLKRTTPQGSTFYLPFQNCKYRSKVQVIDFFPDELENFATPRKLSDYDVLSGTDSGSDSVISLSYARTNPQQVQWEWHFFLWIRDVKSRTTSSRERPYIIVQVAGKDAEYLLNAEACDLRHNPKELAKIKEKLFVMWGDLQEKKAESGTTGLELEASHASVSSCPFECFIQEYGVKAHDVTNKVVPGQYERMFRICGTRIC